MRVMSINLFRKKGQVSFKNNEKKDKIQQKIDMIKPIGEPTRPEGILCQPIKPQSYVLPQGASFTYFSYNVPFQGLFPKAELFK